MKYITQVRLGVAVIGVVLWGVGYVADDGRIRLAGIIVLAVALLLRFVGPRPSRRGPES